ncbi:hypothetical protein WMF20_07570 [Sorangium sp. So ce834]|uniref:hypothetical protein n=1 Tax=Sorangium sp. So ce834 TaxID=3133321 RepID=UPI003F5DA298
MGAWLARGRDLRLLLALDLCAKAFLLGTERRCELLADVFASMALEAVNAAEPMAERPVRSAAHAGTWAPQPTVKASAMRRG